MLKRLVDMEFLGRLFAGVVIGIPFGWGVAWSAAKVTGFIAPIASNVVFYGIGGILTVKMLLVLLHVIRLQLYGGSVNDEPAHRHVPFITGLFWVAVSIVLACFMPSTGSVFWSWVQWFVVAAPFVFGVDSLRRAAFSSDEEIRTLVGGGTWPPR
jgi:hypothetical protein